MCGEHHRSASNATRRPGSSPHVRGTPRPSPASADRRGIIPACAGNTRVAGCKTPVFRDHPRMCGEHFDHAGQTLPAQGSSPHVRGTPPGLATCSTTPGIIPACAGNTRQQGCHVALSRDHPRMCGEHVSVLITIKSETGSSPHVRGTLPIYRLIECSRGIIPACAGNTRSASSPEVSTRDHPRMCGEHFGM